MRTTAAERSAEAERLFARCAAETVVLPTLSDEAEFVLDGQGWAMVDADAWRSWVALADDDREARAAEVRASLLSAGLVAVEPGAETDGAGSEPRAVAAPELGIVIAARSGADVVVAPLSDPTETLAATPYAYVVRDEDAGVRGVVVEVRGGGSHEYRLVSLPAAARFLAHWLHAGITGDELGQRFSRLGLDVMRFDPAGPQAFVLAVDAADDTPTAGAVLASGEAVEAPGVDRESLATLTEQVLRAAIDAAPPTGEPGDGVATEDGGPVPEGGR